MSAFQPFSFCRRGPVLLWTSLALFAVLWVDLIRQLSYTWETNEQYAYGWFVPFLALGLFLRKWPNRPAPGGQGTEKQKTEIGKAEINTGSALGPPSSVFRPPFLLSAFCFLLCLSLLPLRVIIEINPDWPLASWLLTLVVVALTLYAIHLADPSSAREVAPPTSLGPKSVVSSPSSVVSSPWSVVSPWVKHFSFPICFILVAVQWPYRIEHSLTQNLMQVVASLTVEIIGWFGIPALQRGNLIELSTGVLGVDEACSGIRSFQSTLMAALFLGELYRMRWTIRLLLVGAGLTAAFLLNVCRTLILTWQANAHGLGAIDKWHDPAGLTIAVACFGVLWLLALLIKHVTESKRGKVESRKQKAEMTADAGSLTPESRPLTPVLGPRSSDFRPRSSVLCRRYLVAVGLWSLLCIGFTEVWYRSHAVKDAGVFHWTVALPETKPGFEKIELPPRSLKLLAFDVGATGRWREDDGGDWTLYFFRWNPNSIGSVIQSRNHRPDVCLPAAGLRQVSESKMDLFDAGNLKLPFRSYIYEAEGRTLYVFFCQWEDGAETQAGLASSKQTGRLQSVLTGRRLLGQQSLELILTGYDSLQSAKDQLRQKLPLLIARSEARQVP